MTINNNIEFYRDCFQADSRTSGIHSIFGSKAEHLHFIEGKDELLCGHLPKVPIPKAHALAITEKLDRYKKEKSLFVMPFLISGSQSSSNSKSTKYCAPVLLCPAQITTENDYFYLSYNLKLAYINHSVLDRFKKDGMVTSEDIFAPLFKKDKLDFESIGILKSIIEKYYEGIQADPLLFYPELEPKKNIEQKVKQLDNMVVLSACAYGVLTHSKATLGIMSELRMMASSSKYSTVVKRFFDSKKEDKNGSKPVSVQVPTTLSKGQLHAIQNANKYNESLIYGPPGTGKSYTIAALALDQVNKGKSVLIVSKTNPAVDVIAYKIEEELG